MCLLDYNKEIKKYKHITYAERTIRREIKRGLTTNLNTYIEEIEVYSANIAHDAYLLNLEAKGQELKIGSNIELVNRIETMIKKEKKSPEVIAYELNEQGLIEISARTIRNYIYDGNVFNLTEEDMIYNKKHKSKNKEKRIAKHTPPETSIENRPKEANEKTEYGHWEGDLIIGKRKKGCVLLTFTERMTREEIIIKTKGKNNEYVVKAINGLERKYGKRFYTKFKTITFDNGVEFMDYEGMEKSCFKKGNRTQIYYAHPYCSGERGTNENNNRMIRRWIPKGTIIDNISKEFIQQIEDWLNNYPRSMFGYKSLNMLLLNI